MIDRRLVTDIGLALLIAFPATLPAAPSPWSTAEDAGNSPRSAAAGVNDDFAHGALARTPRGQGNS